MTKEDQILDLLKQNNKLLMFIVQYIQHKEDLKTKNDDTMNEFLINVLANMVACK